MNHIYVPIAVTKNAQKIFPHVHTDYILIIRIIFNACIELKSNPDSESEDQWKNYMLIIYTKTARSA